MTTGAIAATIPGMEQLLSLIDAGKVWTVIIAKLGRLTRSVKDLAELLERFQRRGVSLVSATFRGEFPGQRLEWPPQPSPVAGYESYAPRAEQKVLQRIRDNLREIPGVFVEARDITTVGIAPYLDDDELVPLSHQSVEHSG